MGIVESILFPDLVECQAAADRVAKVHKKRKKTKKRRRSLLHPDNESEESVTEESVVAAEVPVGVCHYRTGAYQPVTNQRLPADICSLVQDCIVGCCTNVLLLYKEKVLLGERNSYPQMSWWFPVTGRNRPGLIPQENCKRLCLEKLGFEVENLSRFQFVGTYSYLWQMREVPPREQGRHEMSVVFAIDLQSKELPKDFSTDEFSDMKWLTMMELSLGDYHTAVHRALRDYHLAKDLTTLVSDVVCMEELDVSVIGQKFKLWCSKRQGREFVGNKVKREDVSINSDVSTTAQIVDLGDEENLQTTNVELGEVHSQKTMVIRGGEIVKINKENMKETQEEEQ